MTLKKLINTAVILFIGAALMLLFGKKEWFPDFYFPKVMAAVGLISAFLLALPGLIFKPDNKKKSEVLNKLKLAILFCLILGNLGGLGLFQLYKYGLEYDKVVHFITGFALTSSIAYFIFVWYSFSFWRSVYLATLVVFLAGVTWELLEFYADRIFQTKTFGIYGAELFRDTMLDFLFNIAGIIIGIFVSWRLFSKLKT